jgi:hypothetical protein
MSRLGDTTDAPPHFTWQLPGARQPLPPRVSFGNAYRRWRGERHIIITPLIEPRTRITNLDHYEE